MESADIRRKIMVSEGIKLETGNQMRSLKEEITTINKQQTKDIKYFVKLLITMWETIICKKKLLFKMKLFHWKIALFTHLWLDGK